MLWFVGISSVFFPFLFFFFFFYKLNLIHIYFNSLYQYLFIFGWTETKNTWFKYMYYNFLSKHTFHIIQTIFFKLNLIHIFQFTILVLVFLVGPRQKNSKYFFFIKTNFSHIQTLKRKIELNTYIFCLDRDKKIHGSNICTIFFFMKTNYMIIFFSFGWTETSR